MLTSCKILMRCPKNRQNGTQLNLGDICFLLPKNLRRVYSFEKIGAETAEKACLEKLDVCYTENDHHKQVFVIKKLQRYSIRRGHPQR